MCILCPLPWVLNIYIYIYIYVLIEVADVSAFSAPSPGY